MAFDHGKGAAFKLDNSGGTLTDISAYVNNVDFSWEADAAETTVFSNNDRTYIVGLRNATISVSGYWESATFDPIAGAVVGASATLSFEYGPQGGSSGAIKYSVLCPTRSTSRLLVQLHAVLSK
jgi:hypothetical protein